MGLPYCCHRSISFSCPFYAVFVCIQVVINYTLNAIVFLSNVIKCEKDRNRMMLVVTFGHSPTKVLPCSSDAHVKCFRPGYINT